MTKTKAERLSDSVVFQHGKIGPPKPTNATLVIKALALFLESIKGVTKGFRKAALKNGVNMRDIERLTEVTSRLTSNLPEVADTPIQVSPRFTQPLENVDKVIDRPNVAKDELRRSPRLAGQQAPTVPENVPARRPTPRVQAIKSDEQPSPRVPAIDKDKQPSPRTGTN